jgi:hypothetical protein
MVVMMIMVVMTMIVRFAEQQGTGNIDDQSEDGD